ncbi:serine peptidase-like protein [Setomelanomma holmii]|uniref:Serine peptidase-like protein n=1 Tax=Setomelanomma holmii TaxID=210430 RepID=A0A9P4LMK4_9PLEO|nr:serine peptidase-like protein [Setomelanomma holmii]
MRFSIAVLGLLFGLETAALRVGSKTIPEIEREIAATQNKRGLLKRQSADDEVDLNVLYPEHNISVPIDYFHNETRYKPHSNGSFNLRYWFDTTYYKPGGPVFVLLGGETDGTDRLPFLQKGIVYQVAKATGGLGVIMEHRYYGKSFPVDDLTTENMRFLSTEQALADVDYLARNVKFEGIDADLTAPNTPWVVYGGSYAGAQASFLRVQYPETFWGAISSSGVTVAIYDYWQYFEPARLFGPPDCIKNTQILIDVVDKILLGKNNTSSVQALKDVFGLGQITDNRDFANQLTGVYGLQSTNWDPAENSASFFNYCTNITATPTSENLRPSVSAVVSAAGYEGDTLAENVTLNAIAWLNSTSLRSWRSSNLTQDQYYTTLNATAFQSYTSLSDFGYTSWSYQVCSEWGFIQTGNTPADIMPLISRTLDVDYLTFFCRAQFNITTPPALENVNKYGAYNISYPRLAQFGGNSDPWRPATPLWYPESRTSTKEEPWLLISHGVHHWEENGVFPNETTPLIPPPQIVYAQQFLKNFVVDWVDEWKSERGYRTEL